jgi:hypothetical protein
MFPSGCKPGMKFMNPPPILQPPPLLPRPPGKSFAHQAARGSLLAPLLAILVSVAARASEQTAPVPRMVPVMVGVVCLILIITGFVMGMVGLWGIKQQGPRGILGRSIAGLIINGLLLFFFVVGFMAGWGKGIKSRQFVHDLKTTAQDIQAQAKGAYDPRKGITNADIKGIDRLRTQFDNAAQTLSGDDALIAQAMSLHVTRMEAAMKVYQSAVAELRASRILSLENLSDKPQITSRRAIVRNFLSANGDLENVVSNSEKNIRADLTRLQVGPAKMNAALTGYRAKAVPRTVLVLKIRECDDRYGQAMLAILDLLEANWGKWDYDSIAKTVRFEEPKAQDAYRQCLATIKKAGQEQVQRQGELVNLP